MADQDGDAAGDAAAPGTEAEALGLLDWTCRLMGVERIAADPEDEDGEDIFGVKFAVDGPNASGEVEILVTDHDDEAEVIAIALDTLHRAMAAWGGLTENRRIAARDPIA